MRAHPEYVGGTRRDVTALIRGTEGLIAKDGAEAVHAVGLADGRGVALKIADGGQRARPVVLAAVLRRLGVRVHGLRPPRGRSDPGPRPAGRRGRRRRHRGVSRS